MASPAPTKAFLESGSALIVATVADDLTPHASRGWGLDVLADDRMRLLVDADDAQLHANLASSGAIAITASSVVTLRSVQLKGRANAHESGTDADTARMRQYCDAFFADIQEIDGVSPELLERIVPARLASYEVSVDAVFDQTPGPQAGSSLAQ